MESLGVGVIFNGVLAPFFAHHPGVVDFVSVIPERFWTDLGRGSLPRFVPLAEEAATLDALSRDYPLVAHGIGLSLGTAGPADLVHVEQMRSYADRYGFRWISEHLSAVRVAGRELGDQHAGLAIPLPWDESVLDELSEKVKRVQAVLGQKLLLENGVVHTPVPDPDMDEVTFLNRLCRETGCGLLLDLHNLYVNAVNLGIDAGDFLAKLELANVAEIHIAGGDRLFGAYLDSHAGPCPPAVWDMLDEVVPRCLNLCGITFEFHETYYQRLTDDGILAELARARLAWSRRDGKNESCRLPTISAPSRI
jgi:uncharacterized protein